jgi:hypothetical protein
MKDIRYEVVWIIPINSPPDIVFGHVAVTIENMAVLLAQGDEKSAKTKKMTSLFRAGAPREPAQRILTPSIVTSMLCAAVFVTKD